MTLNKVIYPAFALSIVLASCSEKQGFNSTARRSSPASPTDNSQNSTPELPSEKPNINDNNPEPNTSTTPAKEGVEPAPGSVEPAKEGVEPAPGNTASGSNTKDVLGWLAGKAIEIAGQPKTEPSTTEPTVNTSSRSKTQKISCADEKNNKTLTINKDTLKLEFASDCSTSTTEEVVHGVTEVDIIFVVDVSTSMNPYLNVIKNNIIEFSESFSEKGVNARFGAVGYVDYVTKNISLTNIDSFVNSFKTWHEEDLGNTTYQEAGQAGIEKAIEIFMHDFNAPDAQKNIFFVSDAISFAGNNSNDFSTTNLESKLANINNKYNFRFLHSLPKQPTLIGEARLGNNQRSSMSPSEQMSRATNNTQVNSVALNFPFSKDIFLGQFKNEVHKELVQKQTICSFAIASDNKNALQQNDYNVYTYNENVKDFTADIQRCCGNVANCQMQNFTVKFKQ